MDILFTQWYWIVHTNELNTHIEIVEHTVYEVKV